MSGIASASASASVSMATPGHEAFIQDPLMNRICFDIIHNIANEFTSSKIALKDVRFFVKGGAAATLVLKNDPLQITNDIDCAVLVRPTIEPRLFETIRVILTNGCIEKIVAVLNRIDERGITYIQELYRYYGLAPPPPSKQRIHIGGAAEDGIHLIAGVNTFLSESKLTLRPDLPFRIEILPSLLFRDKSLQMAVIKFRTHTEPSIDMLDIALPARTYSHLSNEWEHYTTIPFRVYGKDVPVLDPIAQIYNQKRAKNMTALGNTSAFDAKAERRGARSLALEAKFASPPLSLPLPPLIPFRQNVHSLMMSRSIVPVKDSLTRKQLYVKRIDLDDGDNDILYWDGRSGYNQYVILGSNGYLKRLGNILRFDKAARTFVVEDKMSRKQYRIEL